MSESKIPQFDFINREKERAYLEKYFRNTPNAILFLYGPKSCGKSTLLNRVVRDLDQEKYAINFLDLRQVMIENFKSFLDIFFQRDLKTKTKDILSGTTFNIGFFKIDIRDEEIFKKNSFKIIIDQIRKAREKGIQPVIVIDEIQELKNIYTNDEKKLLDELFNLFIALTKVENLAHIVLSTSDSYFIEEMYRSAKLSKTSEFYFVDHLGREDIFSWLSNDKYNLSQKDIEYIYNYFGGSPWEIRQILVDVLEGEDLKEIVSDRIKQLSGKVLDFYHRDLEDEGVMQEQFRKISTQIAQKGFYIISAQDKISKILRLAIEKDLWFYEASDQKITANSRSLEHAFGRL